MYFLGVLVGLGCFLSITSLMVLVMISSLLKRRYEYRIRDRKGYCCEDCKMRKLGLKDK